MELEEAKKELVRREKKGEESSKMTKI